ncbi:MAG TPA: hypothetical protein VFO69_14240 [Allosphingosinicella sp.]|nr:hypothetical protein [Allosphingosinicella sp.]
MIAPAWPRLLTGSVIEVCPTRHILNASRIDTNSYRVGRSFSLGIEVDF